MLELDERSFQYMDRLMNGGELPQDMPEELLRIKSAGHLTEESNVKHVAHAATEFVPDYLERRILKLTLQVTQNCNFRCRYCVYSEERNEMQRSHSPKNMDWEMAKRAIDFLWEHSADSDDVNIGFYGGEPLLQMGLIRQAVEYAERLFEGKNLGFSMTTNATLLTEELVRYLDEHGVSLMISLDGPKAINDQNRVFRDGSGTYDTVMEKIAMIRRIAPEYAKNLQISMVMDPENDFDCINAIYIDEKDFDELFVSATIVDEEYDGKMPDVSEDYAWKYRYQRFLAILSDIGRVDRKNVSPIVYVAVRADIGHRFDIDIYPGLMETDAPGGPCNPGQLRLFCNADGKLFPCERVSETSALTCIGTLEGGIDIEAAKRFLNVGTVTEEQCRKCWCFRYCTTCGKKADAGTDKMEAEKKLQYCSDVRARTYDKMMLYLLFKELPFYYEDGGR